MGQIRGFDAAAIQFLKPFSIRHLDNTNPFHYNAIGRMTRSMTAYARKLFAHPMGLFSIELFSRNRKFFDLTLHIPKEWAHLEPMIRQWVLNKGGRGDVTLRLQVENPIISPTVLRPNMAQLKQWIDVWEAMKQTVTYQTTDADFWNFLSRQKDLILACPDETHNTSFWQALQEALEEGWKEWTHAKKQEGQALEKDLRSRINTLKSLLKLVEEQAPCATEKMREKLKNRIEEMHLESEKSHEAIVREIVLFAERVDIAEEITRLRFHLNSFCALLDADKPLIGDTLDFTVQEALREWNTIASKAQDATLSRIVIDAKTELKRMKEQIQNIE